VFSNITLSPEAEQTSQALKQLIQQEITQQGGAIPFDRYMELALYAPNLGYYSAGSQKFGRAGDFITAPELSPLFSQCLAVQAEEIFNKTGIDRHYLEFGAGSGKMAEAILLYLAKQGNLPKSYTIIELSADLKQRQQQRLKEFNCVQWLNKLPEKPFNGVILANELLDSMPVNRFKITKNSFQEYWVEQGFKGIWQDSNNPRLIKAMTLLKDLPENYTSEISLRIPAWLKSLDACTNKVALLLIDYGYKSSDFYHEERYNGSLMCHYQHQAHADPFVFIGLQDITADIDFSALAKNNYFQVAGFSTQSQFLIGTGIEKLLLAEIEQGRKIMAASQGLKQLMLPQFMGEKFKVMALQKNLDLMDLSGFSGLLL